MTKKTFKPFRIEDLTGWLNTKDYPSEIEDKQATWIENFNFSWNKLVSEKGIVDSWISNTPWIWALTIDTWDVWSVADNKVYKNGAEITSKNWARIKVNWISKTFNIEVLDDAWNIVTNQVDTMEYFPTWVYYYIDINAVEYKVQWNNADEIYENLSVLLIADWYITSLTNNYLYITYSTAITVTIPSYITYVIYLSNIISASSVYWYDEWVKWFSYNINWWVQQNLHTTSTTDDYDTLFDFDKAIRDQFYNSIVSLWLDLDVSKWYLSPYFEEDWTWTIWWAENELWYASIILSRVNSIDIKASPINVDNVAQLDDTFALYDESALYADADVTFILRQWKVDEQILDLTVLWINSNSQLLAYLVANGYPNSVIIEGKYTGAWTTPATVNWILPLTSANRTASPINTNLVSSSVAMATNWYDLNENSFNINTNTFTNDTVVSTLPSLWRSNITIGNLWQLIINKDDWWAYYYTDDVMYSIWDDAVGLPTVGTIYNGKIVVGWYDWNDNIVFSQTSTPSQPLNLLNFADYSAGWQSISWWDKWLITWMMVWENWLYIFKDNSIWYSNSEKDVAWVAFNLIFRKITSNWALSQNTITEVDQEIFYLDWKNRAIRRLWYEQNLTTLRDVSISREIAEEFKNLPEDQPMATSHFAYPNYQISLSSWLSGTVEYNNGNTYNVNDIHFIYNVENKSWTTRTWINTMLVSDKWYFASNDGKVYIDFKWDTVEDWVMTSKLYTFWDDIMYKKFSRFDIVWQIKPEAWQEKTMIIEIWIDWEKIDERTFTKDVDTQIKEKIDLYDIGQSLQFKIRHSWLGSVEIYDAQIHYKWTSIQPQDYN